MKHRAAGPRRLRVLDVFVQGQGVHLEPRNVIADAPRELATVRVNPAADALMLWDVDFELPSDGAVAACLRGPCHVWHVGLRLGQGGRPTEWQACHSRSMFNCDADSSIESTSWRLSARAFIARNEVLEELGGFDARFDTASGAALDAGLRWLSSGALVRHVPTLLPSVRVPPLDSPPTPADGIRVVKRQLGTAWAAWAFARGVEDGSIAAGHAGRALLAIREPVLGRPSPHTLSVPPSGEVTDARVTVLVPTVGRYPYLQKLLAQLGNQTRPPDEVVVVDQNPETERQDLELVAAGLPLRVLHLRPPGQCSARNLGLRSASGTHILFLDDDDEIPSDLIEQHLRVLAHPEVAVSCGLVDDRESGPAPASERFRKASSVLPTNNTMIRREVLEETGLFDPTYDRGARADHDLGMRSYLAGNLHVHDPGPQVFHHHAPMGGLRTHGARRRTRGNSRSTITRRHLRTPTDVYLGLRYYTPEQVDQDLALSVYATLGGKGPPIQRALRMLVQGVLLPDTWRRTRAARQEGQRLLVARPPVPTLPPVQA